MWGNNHSIFPRLLRTILPVLFWIGVWQLAAFLVGSELLLPQPYTILCTFLQAAGNLDFWISCGLSLLRILFGFFLGLLCGALLAFVCFFSRILNALISPLLHVIRATPVASFVLLALLWLRSSVLPCFISALMVIPIVWGNLIEGLRKTDSQLLEMAHCFHLGRWKTFRLIYLPSIRPWLYSASVTSMGLAWKSGVAAEVLCQPARAIGTQLYYSKVYFETEQLFTWTIVVITLSFLLEKLLRKSLQHIGTEKAEQ